MHEERWLVKSSGRILGPFTLEELIQHLRARTLSIIDEVREPGARWAFIREQPLFRELVKQLREEEESNPDATQTTYVSSSRTMTMSVTEASSEEGELTPIPTLVHHNNRSTDARPISASERTVKPKISRSKSFGSLSDQRVQDKITANRHTTRNLIWIVALILTSIAGWSLYTQKRSRAVAHDQAQKYLQVAHEQVRLGAMGTALDFVRKAATGITLAAEDQILFAELLLQVENKNTEALSHLNEVGKITDARLIRELGLAKALAYMAEKNWNEANRELSAILQANPKDEEALHNQALLQYYRGQGAAAWKTVTDLLARGYENSQLAILKANLALDWSEKTTEPQHFREALDGLSIEPEKHYQFRFEKDILAMNLWIKSGQTDELLKTLSKMWEVDPFDSRNFHHPLIIDQQLLSWERLFPLCEKIFKTIPDQEAALALRSVCLYQKGDFAVALQKMDEARKQLSQSKLLAAVQSLLFLKVGRAQEARTLTDFAPGETLSQLVLGQICQAEKDLPCADRAWKKVLTSNANNPMASYGLAMINKERGNDLLARDQLRSSLLISPRYRPFLESRGDSNAF